MEVVHFFWFWLWKLVGQLLPKKEWGEHVALENCVTCKSNRGRGENRSREKKMKRVKQQKGWRDASNRIECSDKKRRRHASISELWSLKKSNSVFDDVRKWIEATSENTEKKYAGSYRENSRFSFWGRENQLAQSQTQPQKNGGGSVDLCGRWATVLARSAHTFKILRQCQKVYDQWMHKNVHSAHKNNTRGQPFESIYLSIYL